MENHNVIYGPELIIANSVLLFSHIYINSFFAIYACPNLFSSKGVKDKFLKKRETKYLLLVSTCMVIF